MKKFSQEQLMLISYKNLLKNLPLIIVILFSFSFNCQAFAPENYLPEAQEQRARELFMQIKCPICAGQTIDSSQTEVALQLKNLVRQKIAAGETDEQIKNELVEQYGENILNSPALNFDSFKIWFLPYFLPLFFLILGLFMLLKNKQKKQF